MLTSLGTQEENSRPYNPSLLTREFAAFAAMSGFKSTFHDRRHTFATFMIGAGTDVRTVSSYLGHASVARTLNVYADVDPEAKFAAVSKIEEAFDDSMSVFQRESKARLREIEAEEAREQLKQQEESGMKFNGNAIPFTAEELRAMLRAVEDVS